jgi:hypothetical protein
LAFRQEGHAVLPITEKIACRSMGANDVPV